MYQFPTITAEMVEQFKVVYKQVYPQQDFPMDSRRTLERMIHKKIRRNALEWQLFLQSSKNSVLMSVDQYHFKIEKNPLRVSSIQPLSSGDEIKTPPVDLDRVRFSPIALERFASLFPSYIESDVEKSARAILAKASEKDAISQHRKVRRVLSHGISRFFRFLNCRFVVVEKEEILLVVTVEQVYWK